MSLASMALEGRLECYWEVTADQLSESGISRPISGVMQKMSPRQTVTVRLPLPTETLEPPRRTVCIDKATNGMHRQGGHTTNDGPHRTC
eukprot:s26_g50.t3